MREKKERPCILFFITEDHYFCSHRLPIARAARDAGFKVIVATRVQKHKEQIIQEGFKLIPLRLRRSNKNPLKELFSLIELINIYRLERPDIVHHVSMKPVLYGSLAARIAHVPAVVNAFAGMGYMFTSNNWKTKLFRPVIMYAFRWLFNRYNSRVILQNPDDKKILINAKVLQSAQINLIRGSGVNIHEYFPVPESSAIPTVVLASRMLWDKGIGEFVTAAQLLKEQGIQARFVLVGKSDPDNPTSILIEQLKMWHQNGVVEWWGYRDDMPQIFAQAHIVCLPSYYGEGVPKVLIEASACGRPIVTTDAPGCREVVRQEENGILVPVRNSKALAEALKRLIKDASLRKRMGAHGREIAIKEFSVEKVVHETMLVYKELLSL